MKRSKFNLSNYKLLSCDMGGLIPCGLVEVLPGDTMQHATSLLMRVSPLLAPVYHPVSVRVHHWFVPHRLVWDNWEDFITGGPQGTSLPTFPTMDFLDIATSSLADYLGIPASSGGVRVSALPFRAYAMIWNEYYRDQDLQAELPMVKTDGNDTTTNRTLQNVGWEKDYFTTARPWEQKGPTVTIPLGTEAPVLGIGSRTQTFPQSNVTAYESDGTSTSFPHAQVIGDGSGNNSHLYVKGSAATGGFPEIMADLSNASAVTVNLLREALALQRYEEARARYGSRYVEYLRYLGVRSSDARLQRPEYLGGGKNTIQFSEVLQTSPSEDAAVGSLKGHGITSVRSNRYRRFFEEHGYVLSLLSVRPKTMYSSGIPRTWLKRHKEDFYQKEFEHIGQQEVYLEEVKSPNNNPGAVFGYQDRYDEYRRQWSSIAGDFQTTLDFWHYARIFATDPALNADFVKCVPTKRTYAVESEDVLWIMAKHNIQARRLLSPRGNSFTF